MELDLSDLIQRSIYMGTFEREETEAIESLLKPGMRFLDIGANVGYFTALARSRVGATGQVYAYEPSPWAFERLSRLISDNRWDNVAAVNAGLAEEKGELALYLGEAGNHTPTMVPHEQKTLAKVPVRRLDDEFQAAQDGPVDVLKIDVEGFEPNVIQGGRRLFESGFVKIVLSEFNAHWLDLNGSSVLALHELFEQCGFRLSKSFGLNRIYTHRSA
jgi:FkbM family methyltransferase